MLEFEWYSEKERLIAEKHGLDIETVKEKQLLRRSEFIMVKAKKDTGLSPEEVEKIKAVQKRHSVIDPGCEKLTPEEFINWHPVGGISWEERAKRMKEAGITETNKVSARKTLEVQLATSN